MSNGFVPDFEEIEVKASEEAMAAARDRGDGSVQAVIHGRHCSRRV
jgi:hypothetical protein